MIKLIKIFLPNNNNPSNFPYQCNLLNLRIKLIVDCRWFLKITLKFDLISNELTRNQFPLGCPSPFCIVVLNLFYIIIKLNSQFYSLQFDEFQLLNAANLFNLWPTQHNSKATEPTQPFINPPPRSALQIRASLVVLCCLFCRFISHPFPVPAPIYIRPRRRRRTPSFELAFLNSQ